MRSDLARASIIAVGLFAARTSGAADADTIDKRLALGVLAVETAVPDLRFEFGGRDGAGFVLSWPIAPVTLRGPAFGETLHREEIHGGFIRCLSDPRYRFFITPFVEPQRRLHGSWRTLAGLTVPLVDAERRIGVLLEGAGVIGEGGGAAVGVGFTIGPRTFAPWGTRLSIVFRGVWTRADDKRADVALDFASPIYAQSWADIFAGRPAAPAVGDECPQRGVELHEPICDPLPCPPGACGPMRSCGREMDCGPCPDPISSPGARP